MTTLLSRRIPLERGLYAKRFTWHRRRQDHTFSAPLDGAELEGRGHGNQVTTLRTHWYNNFFMVKVHLEQVQARIAEAAGRVSRDPSTVRLICVTKGISVDRIQEAVACGVAEIGENRVQEAQEKHSALGAWLVPGTQLRWHLIGHLQRNKVRLAIELFDVIHSVDSLELIEALGRHAGGREGHPIDLLIQVNVSGEASKSGCQPRDAQGLAEAVLRLKGFRLTGLMTMAPLGENPESARVVFRQLRQLRDDLHKRMNLLLPDLSMGMSQDFEVAVEEGATMVRIGTAIFGERAKA